MTEENKNEVEKKGRFCTSCGANRGDGEFCSKCGTSFEGKAFADKNSAQYYGNIGGWLIVLLIGMCSSALNFGVDAIDSLLLLIQGELGNPEISNSALVFGIDMVLEFIIVAAVIYLLVLFFKKSKKFPKYYVWYASSMVVYAIISYILIRLLSGTTTETQIVLDELVSNVFGGVIVTVVASAIWIMYMRKSKRVAHTFIK